MKIKYDNLPKKTKKKVYEEYSKKNPDLSKKLNRLMIITIIGIAYGIFMFIYDLFSKNGTFSIVLDIIVFVFCILSIIKLFSIKKNLLEKFLKNKK